MRWILTPVVVAATLITVICSPLNATENAGEKDPDQQKKWGIECPRTCTCMLSEIRDLPMHRWFLEGATSNDSVSSDTKHHGNEALYDEDERINGKQHDSLGLLRTAICVYQQGSEPEEWLAALPRDVQVLTLLQSPGSGQLTLSAEHFSVFTHLVALEIQGAHDSSSTHASDHHPNDAANHGDVVHNKGEVIIMSDTLRPLEELQFLNLQYVRFLGQPDEAPLPLDTSNYQYTTDDTLTKAKYQWKQRQPPEAHELVFLSPIDTLPYKEYKDAQERAGLSVFAGLSELLFLRVYHCGLKEVRYEMFEGLGKLQYLSLENNKLLFIPNFAFYGTPNLKVLSLARNKILRMEFTNLAGLLELEKLDMSYNNISHLSELSLPPFPKLMNADFRHNPIEQIFAGTFEIMNATETLNLGSNDVAIQFKHSSLQGLKALKKLTILNTKIGSLEHDMLEGVSKLKELQIQGKVSVLSFDAFISVPKLEVLTLHHCEIESISMDSFYGLYGLLALDLSFNLLSSLPPGVFDQQHSLRELQLQNNRLKELPENIFSSLPSKMIRLDGNPWHCSCAMRDWRPMSINKVKVKSRTITIPGQLDKGVAKQVRETQYMFEKSVAPRCKTPVKYLNWNVFHVLRKELRCGKSKSRKSHLWRKHEVFKNETKQAELSQQQSPSSSIYPAMNLTTVTSEASTMKIFETTQSTEQPESTETTAQESSTKGDQYDNNLKIHPLKQQPETLDRDVNQLQVIATNIKPEFPDTTSKKAQQKMILVKEHQEKLAVKESKKSPSEEPYTISNNGQNIIVSKKAWKLEMERLRMEKLKKFKQQ